MEDFWKALATGLTPIIVNALLVVVTAVVGFVGYHADRFVKAQANNKNFEFLTSVASVAVQAAEQLYADNDGDAKKQFALDYVENWLASKGVNVETDAIVAQIEAAVLREFNHPALQEPVIPTDVYSPLPDELTPEELDLGEDNRPDTAV